LTSITSVPEDIHFHGCPFNRAERGYEIVCRLSVRPSVRLLRSVTAITQVEILRK